MNIVIFTKYVTSKTTGQGYIKATSPIADKPIKMNYEPAFTGLDNHRHAARYYGACHGYKIMREVYAAKDGLAWLAEKA